MSAHEKSSNVRPSDDPGMRKAAARPIELVTIGVIAYNEQEALPGLLRDIRAQDMDHHKIEVVLVDSASTDSTRKLMESFRDANDDAGMGFRDIRVLDNPKRDIPSGWNVALRDFKGDAFCRVDAHARIPSDFVSAAVCVLESGEFVCGGPRPTVASPDTPWARTILLAEESAFGSSVASFRKSEKGGYAKAVFMPTLRREVIERVGLYDERLLRTEDNDYCHRILEAGYKIRFDPKIHSAQHARGTLGKLIRQKYANGLWVGKTARVKPKCLSAYHFAPAALVIGATGLAVLGVGKSWAPLKACAGAYALACTALSTAAIATSERRSACMLALPLVFASIHLSYGVGTVIGLVRGI